MSSNNPAGAIGAMDQSIAKRPVRPRGIVIGPQLFDALRGEGRLQRDGGLWFLDEDIFVSIDEGEGWSHALPPQED